MHQTDEQGDYRSYLLRIRRFEHRGETSWRVSLEDIRSSARHGFTDLDALLAFLRQQPPDTDTGLTNPASCGDR